MENKIQTNIFDGKLLIKEVIENPDGTVTIIFDADQKFKKSFKKHYNLKRWSQKLFNNFLEEAIKHSVNYFFQKEKENRSNHEHKNN